jgi:hypothetical protein
MPVQDLCATKPKKESDLWRPGSPREEAKTLVRLIGRNGDSIDDLRRLISVTPAEELELREWAACSSARVAVGIETMIRFRAQVASEFDRLVEMRTEAIPGRERSPKPDSSMQA